jgi:GT2 family glycosyltransferase
VKRFASRHAPASPAEYRNAKRLLNNGLFDPWYYQLQTGGHASATRAAAHFLRIGVHQGLLANPLTDFLRTAQTPGQIAAGLLDGSAHEWPLRASVISDAVDGEDAPAAQDHRGGLVGWFLEHAHAGAPLTVRNHGQVQSWAAFRRQRQRQATTLRRLPESCLFERDYYELQTGISFLSDRAAQWHYLEEGEPRGFAPNRLFEPEWYRVESPTTTQQLLAHYLRVGQTTSWTGPHFHAPTWVERHPEAANHAGGALGHFLAQVSASTPTCPLPGSGVDPVDWGGLKAAVDRAARTWADQSALTAPPPTTTAGWVMATAEPPAGSPGVPITVISDGGEWTKKVPANVKSVLAQTHDALHVDIALNDMAAVPAGLAEAMETDDRIRIVRVPGRTRADRANDVLAQVETEWVMFWSVREKLDPQALGALLGAAESGVGSHGAIMDNDSQQEIGLRYALPDGDRLLWGPPRSLAGMLLPTEQLRDRPFRPEASNQFAWDFLLRRQLQLPFVPLIVAEGTGISAAPADGNLKSPFEHILRAERILDWGALAGQDRDADLVSVLVPTYQDWKLTRAAVNAVLANSGEHDVEVVVLDNGSDRSVTALLAGCFAHDDRVRILRVPRNTNFATGSNLAFAASHGARVVFLNNDTEVLPGWLQPMLTALEDDRTIGAQPLLLYEDGSIQTAGTLFLGSHTLPVHFLSGHPVEDLPASDVLRFPAVTAACVALRASDFAAARGFDPVFVNGMEDVDLCLRLAERRGGDFAVSVTSKVVHHESKTPGRSANIEPNRLEFFRRWDGRLPGPDPEPWARAGFSVAAYVAGYGHKVSGHRTKASPVLVRQPALVTDGEAAGLPSLRWAIKVAAHGGPRGDRWGDVAFANDLAEALRALGQEVVIDRRKAQARPGSDYLDDVALHLRGLAQAYAQPGGITNVMWVISHPDLVDDDELSPAFDLVYSAGLEWAREASERSGREVRPMLQATNADRFRPDGPRLSGVDTLFVGRTRYVYRPIVHDAIDAGAALTVYGDGWEQFIDLSYVKAEHLPNDELPAAYRGARVVLNDHWPDMARLGFLSNRLFDAVACGTRVVTDPVSGVSEVFGPAVQVYESVDDLKALLDPQSDRWPSDDELVKTAAHIAEHHSFTARARTLLADVLDVRGVNHSLR